MACASASRKRRRSRTRSWANAKFEELIMIVELSFVFLGGVFVCFC